MNDVFASIMLCVRGIWLELPGKSEEFYGDCGVWSGHSVDHSGFFLSAYRGGFVSGVVVVCSGCRVIFDQVSEQCRAFRVRLQWCCPILEDITLTIFSPLH